MLGWHWFPKPFRFNWTGQQNTTYTLHHVPINQSKLSFHPYLSPFCPNFKHCHFFCILSAKASQKLGPDSGGRIIDFPSGYHFALRWPGPRTLGRGKDSGHFCKDHTTYFMTSPERVKNAFECVVLLHPLVTQFFLYSLSSGFGPWRDWPFLHQRILLNFLC